jgi:hypothetical protein
VVVIWLGDDADEVVIYANTAAHGFMVWVGKLDNLSLLLQ